MRNTDERMAAVKRRAAEIEKEKHIRRARIISLSSIAACVATITGLSFIMQEFSDSFSECASSQSFMAASMFYGRLNIGYIVIGVLSFLLGMGVTVFCYRMRRIHEEEAEIEKQEQDEHSKE